MIRTVKGDITKVTDVQAIVNAAKIAVRTVADSAGESGAV